MALFTHSGLRPIFQVGLADPDGLAHLRSAARAGRRPGCIDGLSERQDTAHRSDRSPETTRHIARAYRTALAGTG